MTNSAAVTTLNIIVLCIIILSIPLLLWATCQFYKHKSHQIVASRDLHYVMTVAFFSIIGLIFACIPRILHQLQITKDSMYSEHITQVINTMIAYAVLFLFCLKSYLLFFQQRYHSAIQNATWKKEIDAQHEEKNFFITHKKWGSFSFVLKWLSIPYTYLLVIELIASFADIEWWPIFRSINIAFFVIIPVIIFMVLIYRLGEFFDSYGIKIEIFAQFISCVLVFVGYGLISAATASSADVKAIQNSVGVGVSVLIYSVFGFTSVYHPMHLIKKEKLAPLPLSQTIKSNERNTIGGLLDALKNERIFSFFMQHLVKEFATENLLFICELCQIKHHYLMSQNNVLKITKRNNGDLASRPSLSVCGSERVQDAASSELDDLYMVIDFNTCIYDTQQFGSPTTATATSSSSVIPPTPDVDSPPPTKLPLGNTLSFNPSVSRQFSHIKDIQRRIIAYFLNENTTFDMLQLEISNKIPTSVIVQQYHGDLYQQMTGLYEKYVKVGADFEINIAWMLREDIGRLIKGYNQQAMVEGDLYWIMDMACLNLFRLLLGPFGRFKRSNEYKKYINSMEHQAHAANYEFSQIVAEQVKSIVPSLHAARSYERLKTMYQKQ